MNKADPPTPALRSNGEGSRTAAPKALRRGFAAAVAAIVLASSSGCLDHTETASSLADGGPANGGGRRVVLITIDGARWQDVFGGSDPERSAEPSIPPDKLMPRTYEMLKSRGVAWGAERAGCGVVRTAMGANVSLPGYREIFTGRPSWCLDNDCARVPSSVMDEAAIAGVRGVASIGSWEVLARAVTGGTGDVFVAAGRTWPVLGSRPARIESPRLSELIAVGNRAGPFPGAGSYRPDVHTAAIALEYYRTEVPSFFHIGLGDTDEWGHRGDYRAYLDALRLADGVIGAVADLIDASGEAGRRTTVLVAPDHGRNADFRDHGPLHPESGRAFLLAFGEGVTERGIGCAASDITLIDIAPTIRVLLGLARDVSEGAGVPIEAIVRTANADVRGE